MRYDQMTREQLAVEYTAMKSAYEAFCAKGLKLDLSRGKPGAEQLDITTEMLDCPVFVHGALRDARYDGLHIRGLCLMG